MREARIANTERKQQEKAFDASRHLRVFTHTLLPGTNEKAALEKEEQAKQTPDLSTSKRLKGNCLNEHLGVKQQGRTFPKGSTIVCTKPTGTGPAVVTHRLLM